MRLTIFCLLTCIVFASASRAQAPVFEITPVESSITFDVEASVAIKGTFDKWDATLTFTSPDLSTGVLEIKIQAASVDTGSGMKNGALWCGEDHSSNQGTRGNAGSDTQRSRHEERQF